MKQDNEPFTPDGPVISIYLALSAATAVDSFHDDKGVQCPTITVDAKV